MLAPGPKLAACLEVLYRATLDARVMGWTGEREAITREGSRKLAALMDAVHNLPWLVENRERCDEELLRSMLRDYDVRHGGALLDHYDRVVAERSRST